MQLWRELGWHWCWFAACDDLDLASPAALPEWARDSLALHDRDNRAGVRTLAALEAKQSGDERWDAMHAQLAQHGELHAHLRPLWGRKLVELSGDSAEAISRAQALNDKYALDGCDPSSHTGVLSCFGLFEAAPRGTHAVNVPIYGLLAPPDLAGSFVKKIYSKDVKEYRQLDIRGSNGGQTDRWESPYERQQRANYPYYGGCDYECGDPY